MIAIAGAKGGCGKTTTTLGLAAAFARSGVETLAVDADRQLPDLHVVAGVEREPTVAALDRETSWHALAQQTPGTAGAHVLPGKKPTETAELDAALEWLDAGATEVLIDCPSGAGPDVVEALGLADGVVVVTTDSDQSLDAAATTIDIARRLDVPVAGAVFTHCSAVPEAFHSRFDVPVLAVVPESDSPLASDEARTEYERAAEELAALTATGAGASDAPESSSTDSADEFTTDQWHTGPTSDENGSRDQSGVDRQPSAGDGAADATRHANDEDSQVEPESTRRAEDRSEMVRSNADGGGSGASGTDGRASGTSGTDGRASGASNAERSDGRGGLSARKVDLGTLPLGSVAVVEAAPASQSEQLLYGLTAARGTLYVSTERTERAVRAALDDASVTVGSPTVRYLTEDRLSETERLLGELPDGSNVVIDTMAPLERRDTEAIREFLNELKEQMLDTDSVAVLHCLSRPSTPEARATTKHVADAVFTVEQVDGGDDRVTVPKFRQAGDTAASVEAVLSGERQSGSPRRSGRSARTEHGRSNDATTEGETVRPVRSAADGDARDES